MKFNEFDPRRKSKPETYPAVPAEPKLFVKNSDKKADIEDEDGTTIIKFKNPIPSAK